MRAFGVSLVLAAVLCGCRDDGEGRFQKSTVVIPGEPPSIINPIGSGQRVEHYMTDTKTGQTWRVKPDGTPWPKASQ